MFTSSLRSGIKKRFIDCYCKCLSFHFEIKPENSSAGVIFTAVLVWQTFEVLPL